MNSLCFVDLFFCINFVLELRINLGFVEFGFVLELVNPSKKGDFESREIDVFPGANSGNLWIFFDSFDF